MNASWMPSKALSSPVLALLAVSTWYPDSTNARLRNSWIATSSSTNSNRTRTSRFCETVHPNVGCLELFKRLNAPFRRIVPTRGASAGGEGHHGELPSLMLFEELTGGIYPPRTKR